MTEMTEAPASLNFRGITKNGWKVQFTLRDTDEAVLLVRFGKLIIKLEENYQVVPEGKQPAGNGSQNTPVPLPVPPTGVSTDTDPNAAYTFPAERLVGKLEGGKSYWKVQGGKFSKFGVNIWPEILFAAGFKDLDPAQIYDLTGYTAYYTLKDNGKEDKVVNLSKEA